MKPISALFALAALLASVSAHAAPPAGHPSPAAAADMMQLPHGSADADLTQKGKVVSVIDANEYTYIEVLQGKNTLWIAAPKIEVKKNSMIRFEDGAVMTNFRSKLLNRTFPSVMFVNRVVAANDKQ
ncbi:MAG TPA: hypothetical protein VEC01_09485 [Noviherbaspirillum sp.]|uniref:hypothetical protein n=1 Tax=Noviherbaspirillum sp. TaxID=1926288 RepID=UPI002D5A2F4E|nr:hypothetical protein [Noviherbaspirillum sp.]HYD95542.1 hypothetical protein [Noviherbaspirillum sp.]